MGPHEWVRVHDLGPPVRPGIVDRAEAFAKILQRGRELLEYLVEVRPQRALTLAMRWIVDYARKRGEKGIRDRLAGEIMDAADEESGGRGKGGAVKKREDTHRMAEANKAFSHFRW